MKMINIQTINKNLTILTDFNSRPFKRKTISNIFDSNRLRLLEETILENKFDRISLDPTEQIYEINSANTLFFKTLFNLQKTLNFKLHIHSNLHEPNPFFNNFDKVILTIDSLNFKDIIFNWSSFKSVRFVFTSSGNDYSLISEIIEVLPSHAEFTIKQDPNIDISMYFSLIKFMDEFDYYFLPFGNYNKYYSLSKNLLFLNREDAF